jgi:hypothetical protein
MGLSPIDPLIPTLRLRLPFQKVFGGFLLVPLPRGLLWLSVEHAVSAASAAFCLVT